MVASAAAAASAGDENLLIDSSQDKERPKLPPGDFMYRVPNQYYRNQGVSYMGRVFHFKARAHQGKGYWFNDYTPHGVKATKQGAKAIPSDDISLDYMLDEHKPSWMSSSKKRSGNNGADNTSNTQSSSKRCKSNKMAALFSKLEEL